MEQSRGFIKETPDNNCERHIAVVKMKGIQTNLIIRTRSVAKQSSAKPFADNFRRVRTNLHTESHSSDNDRIFKYKFNSMWFAWQIYFGQKIFKDIFSLDFGWKSKPLWNEMGQFVTTYISMFVGAIQTHCGASIQCDQTSVQRLQWIVFQKWMIFGDVTEIDGEL